VGVTPAREKGYLLCRHCPFLHRRSGYPRYFGSQLLSLTRAQNSYGFYQEMIHFVYEMIKKDKKKIV
jgi:hypothetical protein